MCGLGITLCLVGGYRTKWESLHKEAIKYACRCMGTDLLAYCKDQLLQAWKLLAFYAAVPSLQLPLLQSYRYLQIQIDHLIIIMEPLNKNTLEWDLVIL